MSNRLQYETSPNFQHLIIFCFCHCIIRYKDKNALQMAQNTLVQMYRGGIFDHIGFGFCRYSTDKKFLVPHFEKMLYDNALLILAYCKAYSVTNNRLSVEGGFFSAQDADSEGEEGKYYLFTPDEVIKVSDDKTDKKSIALELPENAIVKLLSKPTNEYTLKNSKTIYYVCKGHSCMPPTNDF